MLLAQRCSGGVAPRQYGYAHLSPSLHYYNRAAANLTRANRLGGGVDRANPIIALLVAGGMLIPGNIPNIVAAGTLRIGAGSWAKIGIPMGLVLLGIYFAIL